MTSFFFGNMEKRNVRSLRTIKFTAEWSQKSINFLNVTVSRRGRKVTTNLYVDLYVKPVDSHQYLHSS